MNRKQQVTRIYPNKNLEIDYSEWKKNITCKRYCYYDFDRSRVESIAKKSLKDVSNDDYRILVQALFPQYLLCSGLFDAALLFDVIDGVRIDPPKYFYHDLDSYLNNDSTAKVNRLIDEIEELFVFNNIDCSEDWKEYFRESRESRS